MFRLVFHQFYTSTLLSFIVLILFPVNCILCIWQYFTSVSCLITTEFAAHEGRMWSLQKFFKVKPKRMKCAYTNSLSFWPICHRRSTDIPPTINGQRIAECWPLYRPRHLPIVGRYVDHHSADIPVDTSVDTSTVTSRSTYRIKNALYR